MIEQITPDESRTSRPRLASRGTGGIAVFCLVLAAVWFYNMHTRHDPYFAAMWTPPLLIGLVFSGWEVFFPKSYPPRLEDGPQLKRLKRWKLGLILTAIGFMAASLVYTGVSDSIRFLKLLTIPAYLCVCTWISVGTYIRGRTLSRF
jgi:hypothetical protein